MGTMYPRNNAEAKCHSLFFRQRLQQKLNVPIGLIVSAWGGTPAEVWTPRDTVINNKVIAEAVINKPYPWWPVTPGVLYNSMIHPLMPYDIAGAIWYQGESNRDNPSSYNLLMEKMIASWRKGFGKNFPFLYGSNSSIQLPLYQ